MNTRPEPIDYNHPLTETAAAEMWDDHWDTGRVYWADIGAERGVPDPHILDALRAAFDAGGAHAITDLRDTPAGKQLMAEGWDALIESMSASGEFHDVDLRTMERLNPYREGNA